MHLENRCECMPATRNVSVAGPVFLGWFRQVVALVTIAVVAYTADVWLHCVMNSCMRAGSSDLD